MRRLIEKGLMFGNLVPVASPALVEGCSRALRRLAGRETRLADFHAEISGFSPAVGDEPGDLGHLGHAGANRRFILLTTGRKRAPLPGAGVFTPRGFLRRWIEENAAPLFAPTARDAVAGALDGTVFDRSTPARLFDIRRVTVRADAAGGHVAGARRLAERIARFRSEPDARWDDVLIAEMIGLARVTGR
ncbi:MAG: hypothetical protein N2Z62_04200 [Rhodobacteraceae bacterium]|nr:hypothetical protein [Paracoccaceae bacterium]